MHGDCGHLADGGGVLLAVEKVAAKGVVHTSSTLAIATDAAGVVPTIRVTSGSRSTSTSTSGADIARPLQIYNSVRQRQMLSCNCF